MQSIETKTLTKPLTPNELADFYSVSINTVYFWVSRPDFPRIRVGKHLRFDLEKVQGYFDEQTGSGDHACHGPKFSVQTKRSNSSLTKWITKDVGRVDPKQKGTGHGNL